MSADTLRRAAALMRERAEAATDGVWESLDGGDRLVAWRVTPEGFDDDFVYVVDEPLSNAENAEHIASWHPVVALAVADWLDHEARLLEEIDKVVGAQPLPLRRVERSLAVARAYLGDES